MTDAGWPVVLAVAGRPVVVVGAGPVARRKVDQLLELGAQVTVVSPEVDARVAARATAGEITLRTRTFRPDDLDGAWCAVCAVGDPAVTEAVAAAAEARGVPLNAADDPARGTVEALATLRRGDLVVGVGTAGRAPAVAGWLRDRLEPSVGPEYARLVEVLAEVRAERRTAGLGLVPADWRRALDAGMLDLVREGRVHEAKELLRSCL